MTAVPSPRRLVVLACLLAAGAARAQTAASPAAAADNAAPEASARQGGGSGLGLKWRVPPIAVSGNVSYDLRTTRSRDDGNSLSQLVTLNVGARSYLYQPWFALVSGELGLTTARSRTTSGDMGLDPLAPHEQQRSADRFLTGKMRVDLFPRSRFPFEVHVERSDSRVDSGLASTFDFRTQNIGFSQRYRPVKGEYSVAAAYDHRSQTGSGFRDTQDALTGDYSTRWKYNELSLSGAWNRSHRRVTDESSEFRTLVARHQYAPNGDLSLNTSVNWTQTLDAVIAAPMNTSILQWSTVGVWHREKSPLTLTGAARGLTLRDALGDGRGLDTLGFNVGATYEVSPTFRLSANGTLNTTSSNGVRSQSFAGSGGASWQGRTVEFGGLRYDSFASASAGTSTSRSSRGALDARGSRGDTQTDFNAQVGHTLSRTFALSGQSGLMLSANQALAANVSRTNSQHEFAGPQSSRVLTQTVGATWNRSGEATSAYARASYSDSRELAGTHARFQLLNFQLSGNIDIDRNRSLAGDLTWQRTTNRAADIFGDPVLPVIPGQTDGSRGIGGELTYRHQRLFGFPRLRFSSRLKLAQDVLNQPGTLATIPDRETRLWENRLDWSIGRLESQVVFRVSRVDGKRREYLMWRVQRTFGE